MSMRLQEIHPALVHFPIALLPTALAVDAVGRLTGSRALMDVGKHAMTAAAVSAAVAGVFGLVAQEAVQVEPESEAHDLLVTHRTLNVGAIALSALMAAQRRRRSRPSLGYLAVGLAGLCAVSYSAYLGGKMVYDHGVGVEPAGGVREGAAPEVAPGNLGEAARVSAQHVKHGAEHAAEHLREGEVAPALTGSGTNPGAGGA